MKKLQTQRLSFSEWAIYIVASLGIVALLFCAFFVFPSGDDYGYAFRISKEHFFSSWLNTYLTWSGRYMATLFSIANPLLLNNTALFSVYSIAMIIGMVGCTYFFVKQAITTTKTQNKRLATSLIVFILPAGMPSYFEFFYWFSAYICYTIPCMAILLLLGLFFTIERSEKNLSPFAKGCYFLLASLLIIIAVGCNELTLIVLDCIIPFLLYTKWKQKASNGYLWGWLAIAGFFSVAMVFAPGNFARLELCQKFSDFSHVPFFSVIFTFEFLIKNIPLLASTALVYFFVIAPRLDGEKKHSHVSPYIFLAVSIITIWLMHLFMFISTDTKPLERTENVVFVFLLFAWATFLYIATPNQATQMVGKQTKVMTGFVTLLFLFFMFRFESSINATYADILSGNITQFAKDRQRQIDILKASPLSETDVPSLSVAPKTLTYTLYDEALGLNAVMVPGEPFYGSQPVFPIDTIRVQDSRTIWESIKTKGKAWIKAR